ncbi:MAG: hypothetical protein WC139_11305 [Candidatus Kapaibacterium sp.]
MKRGNLNKEDVYKNFGWKYEDGDYIVNRKTKEKNSSKSLNNGIKDKINRLIQVFIKKHKK